MKLTKFWRKISPQKIIFVSSISILIILFGVLGALHLDSSVNYENNQFDGSQLKDDKVIEDSEQINQSGNDKRNSTDSVKLTVDEDYDEGWLARMKMDISLDEPRTIALMIDGHVRFLDDVREAPVNKTREFTMHFHEGDKEAQIMVYELIDGDVFELEEEYFDFNSNYHITNSSAVQFTIREDPPDHEHGEDIDARHRH